MARTMPAGLVQNTCGQIAEYRPQKALAAELNEVSDRIWQAPVVQFKRDQA